MLTACVQTGPRHGRLHGHPRLPLHPRRLPGGQVRQGSLDWNVSLFDGGRADCFLFAVCVYI
jgi:hypothetical protein